MACIVFDGFDMYTSGGFGVSLFGPRWTTAVLTTGSSGPTSGSTGTRFNAGRGFQFKGADYLGTPLTNQAHLIFGTALKGTPVTSKTPIWALYDGATCQLTGAYDTDGSIKVYRGTMSGTQVAAAAAATLTSNVWSFVEFDVTIDPSAGVVSIWAEGVQVVNSTGLNTRNSSNSQATLFRLGADSGSAAGGFYVVFDDFYLLDTTGPAPWNTLLGDVRVQTIFPSGAGSSTQFTPDTGSNYARVGTEDDDTSYVKSNTAGQKDLYALDDLGLSGNVLGACHVTRWRKDDPGARGVRQIQKSGSTTTNEATTPLIGSSYYNAASTYTLNPATGSAYTAAEIDALQTGVEIVS